VKEAVNLAREAKIPVQVLTENKAALAEIEKARLQKVDIASDSFSFTQLVAAKGVGLERAIQRLSGTPAARLGLRERGILKKGDPADIVVFNPNAIATGLKYVLVNGTIALKDGEPTEARAGQALR
jgi:imidazolonepropionase-like amidohydrolase